MSEFIGNAAPYDRTHRIHQLMLGCFIVNEGQEDALCELLFANEVYACFMTRGKGTSASLFSEVTGVGLLRKIVVYSVMRDDVWELVKKPIEAKFAVSRISHGIGFCVPLTSVTSISSYKMLANIRFFEKPVSGKLKRHKKKVKIIGGKNK